MLEHVPFTVVVVVSRRYNIYIEFECLAAFQFGWCKPVIMKMFCKAANSHCSVISMQIQHTSYEIHQKYKQAAAAAPDSPSTNAKCFVCLSCAVNGNRIHSFVSACLSVFSSAGVSVCVCVEREFGFNCTILMVAPTLTSNRGSVHSYASTLVLTLSAPDNIEPILSTICLSLCECECVRRCLCYFQLQNDDE